VPDTNNIKLSVIIVNYNVEYFLEQCLHAVFRALKNISAEVFVVDNNSVDGSCLMVKTKFPQVKLIENKFNAGFSKANNQAIHLSSGEYILLLNPDTVIEEDTFDKCLAFMDAHPEAGGLGVKMIDGKGNFLPESKRGLPTPAVAFYKIFGISRIFPHSKKFGKYHLSYLDKEKTHSVDILSGAFMLIRKKALEKTGLLDEKFFMYGEDIDLSWRIIQAGYKNYYFPETTIIHYKGESTKKSSVNYVFVFYNAMIIFAQKHFSQKNARIFSFFIKIAIYFRASVAILNRIIKKSFLPVFEFTLILCGLHLLSYYYQEFTNIIFPNKLVNVALPSYSMVWLISFWICGGYDKSTRINALVKGVISGTAILLMAYALFPKDWQFSRTIVASGGMIVVPAIMFSRFISAYLGYQEYSFFKSSDKNILIVGNRNEAQRVSNLLKETLNHKYTVHYVSPQTSEDPFFTGNISRIKEMVDVFKIHEIIFCAADLSATQIIELMWAADKNKTDFKIAQPESTYIIGSNSIDNSGDLYVFDINSINKPANKRNKRIFDVLASLILLVLFPLMVVLPNYRKIFTKLILVAAGKYTFIGYAHTADKNIKLPKIKEGIVSLIHQLKFGDVNADVCNRLNIVYAREYTWIKDLNILISYLFKHN
jgi:GT2 family glycosyltransferase/predicted CoA-binding protein